MRRLITVFLGLLPCTTALAGYSVSIDAWGEIDDAVYYTNLWDIPGSAVHVDTAGTVSVGESIETRLELSVGDDQEVDYEHMEGTYLRNNGFAVRFGENPSATLSNFIVAPRGGYLIGGALVSNVDVIEMIWIGFADGYMGNIRVHLALVAEPGTLLNPDRTIIPETADEFASLITDTRILVEWPNSGVEDAFVTSAEYTITPAPGALAVLVLGGAVAARRRR